MRSFGVLERLTLETGSKGTRFEDPLLSYVADGVKLDSSLIAEGREQVAMVRI